MAGLTIATLDWGNRNPNEFISEAVRNTQVLNSFMLVDRVKSKYQFPIADAALQFGNDTCVFDPQSSASISEKEMSVQTYKWAFKNCKNVLQNTYRSKLLKVGANNAETMDSSFKDWLLTHFAKLAGQKILEVAETEIVAEMTSDSDVIDDAFTGVYTKSNILSALEQAYTKLPSDMTESLFGVNDISVKPVYFMNANTMRLVQLAIAEKYTTSYSGLQEGNVLPYMGIEMRLFATLPDNQIVLTNPENLVMLVDDYADVSAIQMKYIDELSTDYLWGQFTIGFSYQKGTRIVWQQAA